MKAQLKRKLKNFWCYRPEPASNNQADLFAGPKFQDLNELELEIIRRVQPFTMTSIERIVSLIQAVQYIVRNSVSGDFVECGVWKGGSMMAVALTLINEKAGDRQLYLFDTFDGMPEPSEQDAAASDGRSAKELLAAESKDSSSYIWAYCPEDIVRQNMQSVGYDQNKIDRKSVV